MHLWSTTAALAVLLAACGGTTASPGSGSSGASGTSPTGPGADGGPAVDGGAHRLVDACPLTAPTHGAACTTLVSCEYGNDRNFECNTVATCDVSKRWYVTDPSCKHPTPTTDPSCPAASPAAGDVCSTLGAICDYAQGRCGCVATSFGPGGAQDAATPPPQWSCEVPPAAGCPATRPFNGEPCDGKVQDCNYGALCVEGSVAMHCSDGYWSGDLAVGCGGA